MRAVASGAGEAGAQCGVLDDGVQGDAGQVQSAAADPAGGAADPVEAVDGPQQRPSGDLVVTQHGQPGVHVAHRAGLQMGQGDGGSGGVLVALVHRDEHLDALGHEGQVLLVEGGDLAAPGHQRETEHQCGPIPQADRGVVGGAIRSCRVSMVIGGALRIRPPSCAHGRR
ncbi:hypothetical protein ACIBF6_14315 [Streptosporangium amethystogenes]|uniref:hypothetical protein n=1 Tax=Streptosporangium amethystogenes TaxID=2002 RepID=UPI0037A18A7C